MSSNKSERAVILDEVIGIALATPTLTVVAWRWRYELAFLVFAPVLVLAALRTLTLIGLILVTVVALVLVLGVRPVRRLVVRRAWCVITPHRLRTGCAQARIYTRDGKLPIILRTRSIPAGQRVHVWCRAGVYAEQFETRRDSLRAALWARDIRVTRSPRFAHLATIDVIRWDTLAVGRFIPSDLTGWAPPASGNGSPEFIDPYEAVSRRVSAPDRPQDLVSASSRLPTSGPPLGPDGVCATASYVSTPEPERAPVLVPAQRTNPDTAPVPDWDGGPDE